MHVLVLSPHRDDAAFSCGLLMADLLGAGVTLTVVNVCTTSDYAPYLAPVQADWTAHVTQERAREDRSFFERLTGHAGVALQAVQEIDLGWHDAPLRLAMATESVLLQEAVDEQEVDALALAFASLPQADAALAPLGLGGHIDHRLVRDAAARVFADRLALYEDLPYAARLTAEQRRAETMRAAPMHLRPWTGTAAPAPSGTKRAFAMCYPSQIASEVADEMEAFAQQEHDGRESFYACEAVQNLFEQGKGHAR